MKKIAIEVKFIGQIVVPTDEVNVTSERNFCPFQKLLNKCLDDSFILKLKKR